MVFNKSRYESATLNQKHIYTQIKNFGNTT